MLGKQSFRTRRNLEKNGRKATAEITWIADNGYALTRGSDALVANTVEVLKTTLVVRPANEPEFEWTGKLRFPQLGVAGTGTKLAVLFDPEDHEKLMLDESESAQANLANEMYEDAIEKARAESTGMSGEDVRAGSGWDQAAVAPAPAAEDPITQIERLGELKAKGLLSDAEFEQQKARILSQ